MPDGATRWAESNLTFRYGQWMSPEFLTNNWALVAASVVGVAVLLLVLHRLWLQSPRGELGRARRRLKARHRALGRAENALRRRRKEFERLHARAASVRPRRLEEAGEAVEDARALAKIAHDQLLVEENLVRKVIFEEFPPRRQESLRRRYLRSDEERSRPYSG